MDIIDFHVHAGKFAYLRDDIQRLLTNFPFEEGVDVTQIFSEPQVLKKYLQTNGVQQAVILAECGPGTNFSIDSQLIADFCANDPFFVPFGNINPNYHEHPAAEWEKDWQRGIRGYKFYPADHDFDAFSPSMMAVYRRCSEAGQPIMFHTGLTAQRDASQKFIRPGEYRHLVERLPDLRIIFAHGGKPDWYEEALRMAVDYDNVFLDTALVPPEEVVRWLSFHSSVKHKVLFASDLPVCGGYSTLRERFLSQPFSEVDQALVFHENARQVLAPVICEA